MCGGVRWQSRHSARREVTPYHRWERGEIQPPRLSCAVESTVAVGVVSVVVCYGAVCLVVVWVHEGWLV